MAGIGATVALIKALAPKADPAVIQQAVEDYLEAHPEISVADGSITEEKLASDVALILSTLESDTSDLKNAIDGLAVTPEMYGAKGDGTTDDSQAIQSAVNAGYNIKFGDNKTYYLASAVEITSDIKLIGGKNTVIKTKTPTGGNANRAFYIHGTLKKTTTLTSDYKVAGTTYNAGDRYQFTDMENIAIGDIMVIEATDQFYSYARDYYYLGGVLLISDVNDNYVFSCDALPFNIDNTENVTVKIYDAPVVTIEGIRFESDHESAGEYVYTVSMRYCKNSVINTE